MARDPAPAAFEQAFDALIREHYERLANLAYRYLRSDAAAEDAVQEVLLKVWQRRDVVNLDDPLPYLYQAVRNECFMVLRQRRCWGMTDLDAQILEASPDPVAEVADMSAAVASGV